MNQLMTRMFIERAPASLGMLKKQLEVDRISGHDPWKSQPWPAVFTFPSRGGGWLEQIPFVQSWSTDPAGVASMQKGLERICHSY